MAVLPSGTEKTKLLEKALAGTLMPLQEQSQKFQIDTSSGLLLTHC